MKLAPRGIWGHAPPHNIFLILGALRVLLVGFGHQRVHYYCDSNIGKIPSSSIDITASDSSLPNTWVATHVTKEHYQQFNNNEVAKRLFVGQAGSINIQVPKPHNANFVLSTFVVIITASRALLDRW